MKSPPLWAPMCEFTPRAQRMLTFGGRDGTHLQDADLGADEGANPMPRTKRRFQASFEVGMRTPGLVRGSTRRGRREHRRRFQVVVVGEVNVLSDVPRRTRRQKAACSQ